MIIAVDFDGTLVQDEFPRIGKPFIYRMDCVKTLQRRGHKVILWTCRTGEALASAVQFCREYGIIFDAVNENLPEIQKEWGGDTRKVYCDYYVDDKNLPDTSLNFLQLLGL